MTNSAGPDQLASSSEANWSESTLFTKTKHEVISKRRVKKVELGNLIDQPSVSIKWLDGISYHVSGVYFSTVAL